MLCMLKELEEDDTPSKEGDDYPSKGEDDSQSKEGSVDNGLQGR